MSTNRLLLGEPEFFSTSQIRDYCNNARLLVRPLANELRISAEEMEAALRYIRTPNSGSLMPASVRAKLVSQHLRRSADQVEGTCASLVRTYLSFRKHFAPELEAAGHRAPRREFKFGE